MRTGLILLLLVALAAVLGSLSEYHVLGSLSEYQILGSLSEYHIAP
jgi:cytochrome c biogenesis protein ResB